jgi:hypothetical protein
LSEARASDGSVVLLFTDEVSFYRQPSQASLLFVRGRRQPQLRYSHRSNTCMRVAGFLDAVSGRVLARDASKLSAAWLGRRWKEVGEAYPEAKRIYLVMDNWPVHQHPKALAAAERDPRLKLLFLPTYAPWLNPIEKLWRLAKQTTTHAHPWCDDFKTFKEQVRRILAEPTSEPHTLLRYVGLLSA